MTITSAPTITVNGLRSEKLGIEQTPTLQRKRDLLAMLRTQISPSILERFRPKCAAQTKGMFRRSGLRYLRMKVGVSTAGEAVFSEELVVSNSHPIGWVEAQMAARLRRKQNARAAGEAVRPGRPERQLQASSCSSDLFAAPLSTLEWYGEDATSAQTSQWPPTQVLRPSAQDVFVNSTWSAGSGSIFQELEMQDQDSNSPNIATTGIHANIRRGTATERREVPNRIRDSHELTSPAWMRD